MIHFSTNEDGKRVKVVKTVKVTTYQKKVNKRAEERKKVPPFILSAQLTCQRWVKFGRCANAVGKEQGISYVGDEVAFVLGEAQKVCLSSPRLLTGVRNKEKRRSKKRKTSNKSMLCTRS